MREGVLILSESVGLAKNESTMQVKFCNDSAARILANGLEEQSNIHNV